MVVGPTLAGRRPSALTEVLDPIAVTGADFDVQLTGKAGIRPWTVKLANESPYALRIDAGGYVDWLGPWTANVIPTGGANVLHVHPAVLGAAGLLPASPQSSLLVTLAPQGEDIPGTYPMALVRQTSSFQQLVPLVQNPADSGIYTVAPNTVITNAVFPIPASVQSVRWSINQLGANTKWAGSKVVGNVTGFQYNIGVTNGGSTGGFDENFALFPEDTALLFSIDTTGSPSAVEYWFTATEGMGLVAAKLTGNGTADGLAVFVRNDSTPATWQAATKRVRMGFSTAGPNTVLGAPTFGYKLLGALFAIRAGGAGFIELNDGTNPIADVWLPAINNSIFVQMFGLPIGANVVLNQSAGNTCDGQLYYNGS